MAPRTSFARFGVSCLIALGVLTGLPGLSSPARAEAALTPVQGEAGPICDSVSTCISPRQFEEAYGITPLLQQGMDGRGETVVLPELAEPQFPLPTTDIRADLARFDQLFDLPAAHVRAVTTLALAASPWLANGEEVLDTEVVHTVAPGATIVELLLSASSMDNPANAIAASAAALRLGSTLGGVISMSAAGQTGGEGCDSHAQVAELHAALHLATDRHVTVVVASGDVGSVGEPCNVVRGLVGGAFSPVKQVNLPAADPLVLAAGGTTISVNAQTGAYLSESAWGLPYGHPGTQFQGSGGGFSRIVPRPSYQDGVPGIGGYRGVPDVAAIAEPNPGFPVVTSNPGGGYTITGHGGTSASAPLWAGIVALADQEAGHHLGFVNAAIYRIASGSAYHQAFHDVTTGNNAVSFPPQTIGGYAAGPGWDAVTGWGSPDASVLVPLLAHAVRAGDAHGL